MYGFNYAQTNLQLYDQLIQFGYSKFQLKKVYSAYQLATELSSGFLRPSGKTHIQHLVGTASVLVNYNSPVEIINAGLLHSVYKYGDFGDGDFRVKQFKRKKIRSVVGKDTENYILSYTNMKWWGSGGIDNILNEIQDLGEHQKDVVLIRLADVVDEFLDLGNLYCRSPERVKFFDRNIPKVLEIADKLGHHKLGNEIRQLMDEEKNSIVPEILLSRSKLPGTYLTVPLNCVMKIRLRAKKSLRELLKKLTVLKNRLKNEILFAVKSFPGR